MAIFSLCPCLAFFFFLCEHLLVCSDLLFLQGRRLDYIPTLMSTFSLIKSPISKYCHPPRPWRLGLQHINSKRTQHSPYIKGGMHRTIPSPRWAACETDVSPCPNTHTHTPLSLPVPWPSFQPPWALTLMPQFGQEVVIEDTTSHLTINKKLGS